MMVSRVADRFLRKWAESLKNFEEADATAKRISAEYRALIGHPRHRPSWWSRNVHRDDMQIFTRAETKTLTRKDAERQDAVGDRAYYATEAAMWGIAAMVEMMGVAAMPLMNSNPKWTDPYAREADTAT